MSVIETTTMSYVFPAAQCDLDLSLGDKGMLNAITYGGTIASAFMWGFIFDTMGRKRPLIAGFLLDGIFAVLSGFSQNVTFLMVMKFFGGFIMNGPYAALTTYLCELHEGKYRSRMPIFAGLSMSIGTIYLPFLASFILPMNFKLILADYLVLHSWSLFLLLNALPALMGGMIFFFLPETPKFLMTMGRNEQALKVFQMIYSLNTGKPKETYPIKILINEPKANHRNEPESFLLKGWRQISPLFAQPFLGVFILVCSLQLFMTMGQNTLRLWLPQLFQAINDYKFFNNGTSSTLCNMLSVIQPTNETEECFVNFDNSEVYVNSMIVSAVSVVAYVIVTAVVNVLGRNTLLKILGLVASGCAVGIYFSPHSDIALIFIAGFNSLSNIGSKVILVVVVDFFPTTLRTMTVSLVMMCGRGAAMIGNIIFPKLLEMGCGPPFFSMASLFFVCFCLSFLLPKPKENFV
ncbi:hypothetical protein HHI36_016780 [Cryptolaemus montrouzieri]